MGGALTFSDNKGSAPPHRQEYRGSRRVGKKEIDDKEKQQKKTTVTIKEWI